MRQSPGHFAAFIALLVLAHLFLHVGLGIGRAAPDLLAVAVLLASRRTDGAGAAALGVCLGLLDDALGISAFGIRAFSLGFAAWIGAKSREVVEGDIILFTPALLFFGTWVAEAVAWVTGGATAPLELVTTSPAVAAYAAVAGMVAIMLYRSIAGRDV
jgi:rod shape-determining protein MreD